MSDLLIHHGDCIDVLPTLAADSVQCVVTSPPYFGLRDYGLPPSSWPAISFAPLVGVPPVEVPAQSVCLGLESDPLAYTAHLLHVFRLLRRVLAADGVCWLNLGDSYSMDRKWGGASGAKNYTSAAGGIPRDKRRTGLGDKQLLCIPHRVALALQADGWYLRSDVIWDKPNAMPESVTDRPTRSHEYLFLLAKSPRYFYNADAIKEPAVDGNPEQPRGSRGNIGRPNAAQRRDKQGEAGRRTDTGFHERWEQRSSPLIHRNRRSVWRVSTQPYAGAHYAPMPERLIEPCVLSGSRPGDLVLDPFGGTGAVGRVALAHQRCAILVDLNPAYVELQHQRTNNVQVSLLLEETA